MPAIARSSQLFLPTLREPPLDALAISHQLLVRAGFKPSLIKLRYHKFGLNLFAIARREDG